MTGRRDTLARLCQTMDEATVTDVASLVDEALMEARVKVRAALAEAFAENLFDLAEEELQARSKDLSVHAAGPRPSTDDGVDDGDPEEPQGFGLYVYGVIDVDADLAPGVRGIDDIHEVFSIRGESVAAVASLVALEEFGEEPLRSHLDDLSWLEHRARRHEQILEGVRELSTLVPMRLCTIYRDEQSVREMLAREHAFLADALRRLEGRTEWGVKMYEVSAPSQAPVQDATEEEEEEEGLGDRQGPGASYLMGKRLEDRRRERALALVEERCELAHSQLAQAAVEAKLNPVQPRELTGRDEPMVFNGVYLVDDAAFESFTSVLRSLEPDLAETGLELELTGPWTPYNFVNSPTEVGR